MKFNIKNRVLHMSLGRDQALRAVYEAVANSFDALNEDDKVGKQVIVRIIRQSPEDFLHLEDGSSIQRPIIGFEIEDNGIGFTPRNYDSFCEADSDLKLESGGKGIGRLLWLKAFDHAQIESCYLDEAGKVKQRWFKFDLNGIEQVEPVKRKATRLPGTIVKLVGLKNEYTCPASAKTIARHLIEHTLEQMLNSDNVKYYLEDIDEGNLDLHKMFRDEFRVASKTDSISVSRHKFKIRHLLVKTGGCINSHKMHFCARKRRVIDESLTRHIRDLKEPLQIEDESVYYLGTITGDYLDECVNDTRTALMLPEEPDLNQLSKLQISGAAANKVRTYLADHLNALKVRKDKRVRDVVAKTAPELRTVIDRHPDMLERIALDDSDTEILTTVSGQRYADRESYIKLQSELLSKAKASDRLREHSAELISRFASESQSQAMIALAGFVCHRRAVLDVLNSLLGTDDTGNSYKEEAVHQLIFPLRKTSDELPPDLANLWVIDEKLAFHHYLASDKTLDSLDPIESDAKTEPDLISFDYAHVTSETAECPDVVTIVEFKRPGREQYNYAKNPYSQIKNYVNQILDGKARDRMNRIITVTPKRTRFFAYIIADLIPNLRMILDREGFQDGPDADVMFKHDPNFPLYTEAFSYQKLIADAVKRNRSFFHQLGVH